MRVLVKKENMPKDKLSIEIEIKKIGQGLEQVQREMKELTGQVKAEGAKIRAETTHMTQGFSGLSSGISRVRNLLIGLGAIVFAKKIAGEFLDTARSVEQMELRLKALLGDAEEGKKLFDDLADFAARVPFELREIMESATTLAGIMRGGRTEIMQWMPLIADLAAVTNLNIETVTTQIMRMLSAGAASADLFRERGVLAMLGFQAGVSYSAEETRKKLWEAWASSESRFRGATQDMARSWDGMTSMLSDAWFQLRKKVMESGVFDWMKAGLTLVLRKIDELKKEGKLDIWAKGMAQEVIASLKGIALASWVLTEIWFGWREILKGIPPLFDTIFKHANAVIADFLEAINFRGVFDEWIADMRRTEKGFDILSKKGTAALDQIIVRHELIRGFFKDIGKEIEEEIKKLKTPVAKGAPGVSLATIDIGPTKEAIALNEKLKDEVIKLTKTKLEQLEIWRQEQLAIKGVNEEYVNTIYNIKREALEREAAIEAAKKYTKEWLEAYKKTDDYWDYFVSKNKESTEQIKMDWEALRSDLQWSLEAGFFDIFKGGIEDINDFFRQFCNNLVESFARAVSKMITEWLVFKAITQIGGGISGLFGGGGTELVMAQHGLMINEPILGIGQSGQRYLFGEAGPEAVVPARGLLGRREEEINIYIVDERAKTPVPTRNDIIFTICDDYQRDGPTRKTIKRFT